jgi:hypothetical protein
MVSTAMLAWLTPSPFQRPFFLRQHTLYCPFLRFCYRRYSPLWPEPLFPLFAYRAENDLRPRRQISEVQLVRNMAEPVTPSVVTVRRPVDPTPQREPSPIPKRIQHVLTCQLRIIRG